MLPGHHFRAMLKECGVWLTINAAEAAFSSFGGGVRLLMVFLSHYSACTTAAPPLSSKCCIEQQLFILSQWALKVQVAVLKPSLLIISLHYFREDTIKMLMLMDRKRSCKKEEPLSI